MKILAHSFLIFLQLSSHTTLPSIIYKGNVSFEKYLHSLCLDVSNVKIILIESNFVQIQSNSIHQVLIDSKCDFNHYLNFSIKFFQNEIAKMFELKWASPIRLNSGFFCSKPVKIYLFKSIITSQKSSAS